MLAAFKEGAKEEGNRTGSRSTRGPKRSNVGTRKRTRESGNGGLPLVCPSLKGPDNGKGPSQGWREAKLGQYQELRGGQGNRK